MPFYTQTNIPISNDFMLVGYLEKAVREGVGKPWQNANTTTRKRVYAKYNSPGRLPAFKTFVDISGRKLAPGRKWRVAVTFRQPMEVQHESGQWMRGQRRVSLETTPAPPTGDVLEGAVRRFLESMSAPAAQTPAPGPELPTNFVAGARTPSCIICYDALASTVFVGCGHRCACVACGRKLGNKCPICRVESHPIVIRDA